MTTFDKQTIADVVISLALEVMKLNVPGLSKSNSITNSANFEECKGMLSATISNYKKTYKGLNNIFKFSNENIVKKV